MNLSALDASQEYPDRVAVVGDGFALSFAELAERVTRRLGYLQQLGCSTTNPRPLALVARLSSATLELLYAAFAAGIPVYPLHPRLPPAAIQQRLDTFDLSIVDPDCGPSCEPLRDPIPPIEPERPLAVVETSGSSGEPKHVVLSRSAFVAAASASAAHLGWQPDDRWLLSLPTAHIGGLSVVTRCLLARRTLVVGSTSDAHAIATDVARHRVTLLSVVPTVLRRLLRGGWDCPSHVRAILVGGAPISSESCTEARSRGWPVLATYGLTETCSQVATQSLRGATRGVGRTLAPLEARTVDGQIEVRGPTLFSGYAVPDAPPDPWGVRYRPADLVDGWFRTRDRGRIAPDGTVEVYGRVDDVIISGGENIDPIRVEHALEALDGVVQAAVFGVPDADWGRVLAALIVVHPNIDVAEIPVKLGALLGSHEIPRRLRVVDTLPQTPAGKLDRARLVW